MMRVFYEGDNRGTDKAGDTGDDKGRHPEGRMIHSLCGILEISCNLGSCYACNAIGRKNPAVIGAHILIAEIVGRCRREKCKITAKVKTYNRCANNKTERGAEGNKPVVDGKHG